MELNEQLQTLGLNEKEAKIYLASLELGLTSIQDIAKKAKVKRSTVYEIMENLIKQNLITIIPKGKKRYFLAAEPAKLAELINQKQKVLTKMMPELEALSKVSPIKPKIRFYEGEEGIKAVYADTIKDAKEILAFVSVASAYKSKVIDYLTKQYVLQRSEKKIMAKVIAPDSPLSQKYKKRDKQEYRQTKLISEKDYPFSIEINIYGNKIAFMSYNENELMGVIIESKEIAKTMRSIHRFFWDRLK
jgi:HTH-type transcriptional regulator, sugar sensing transcriptional regulator